MKKLLFLITLMFVGMNINAQSIIEKTIDPVDGKTQISLNKNFALLESPSPSIIWLNKNKNNDSIFIVAYGFYTTQFNCREKTSIIIVFEDGSRIKWKTYEDFHCKNSTQIHRSYNERDYMGSFYELNGDDEKYKNYSFLEEKLRNVKITHIRMINGRDGSKEDYPVVGIKQDFYIRVFKAIDEYNSNLN